MPHSFLLAEMGFRVIGALCRNAKPGAAPHGSILAIMATSTLWRMVSRTLSNFQTVAYGRGTTEP